MRGAGGYDYDTTEVLGGWSRIGNGTALRIECITMYQQSANMAFSLYQHHRIKFWYCEHKDPFPKTRFPCHNIMPLITYAHLLYIRHLSSQNKAVAHSLRPRLPHNLSPRRDSQASKHKPTDSNHTRRTSCICRLTPGPPVQGAKDERAQRATNLTCNR